MVYNSKGCFLLNSRESIFLDMAADSASKQASAEVIKIGYETLFNGELEVDKPLDEKTFNYLKQITEGKHEKLDAMPEGWCPWKPDDEKTIIADDGTAYYAEEWLAYIIEYILKPKRYLLNGQVDWYGDECEDRGRYIVTDNTVKIQIARFIYEDA